jgi:hypothetical protein
MLSLKKTKEQEETVTVVEESAIDRRNSLRSSQLLSRQSYTMHDDSS